MMTSNLGNRFVMMPNGKNLKRTSNSLILTDQGTKMDTRTQSVIASAIMNTLKIRGVLSKTGSKILKVGQISATRR